MTIKDIARESGYAIGTVSRVLNQQPGVSEEARRRVMEVVEKYHFKLNNNAKRLKQQDNRGIALIVKGTRNMLFASIVETLQRIIMENGFACLIYYIGEDEHEVEQALQICRDRQPMGILFLGSNQENFKDKFALVDIPCVVATNSVEGLAFANLSSVSVDDVKAAKMVIEYLMDLGHERIGVLGGVMDHSNPAKSRYEGCIQAFEEHGMPFEPQVQFVSSYFTMEGGYDAMRELLSKYPNLTAVFAMSDVTALGAVRAIKDAGLRVPEDVSVVGFDGIELAKFTAPRLATVQQPGDVIAKRCVEILLQCIEKKGYSVREQVAFSLIEGESIRNIKQEGA